MKSLKLSQLSIFVGHGFLQHAGYGSSGYYGLCYHTYFIPSSFDLEDVVAIVYGATVSA